MAFFVLVRWLFWWLLRKFLWLLSRPPLHARLSMSAQPDRNPYSLIAAKVTLRLPRPTSLLIESLLYRLLGLAGPSKPVEVAANAVFEEPRIVIRIVSRRRRC